ncbi:hypothetical protein A2867_03570 [Candidatus Daviesbacteria bacterium RIFCSPHIGHO2_01_FULL_40_11]|uniref:Glycosyltransferase 2-like domain-containing protein n=1 Tax=Candidatus Daviesbacteria bacterium RIFCSPHIGHO2_01_FULL_40_11 TaxID=1797762 RepID=A0A1F5JK28_9BACT|nr:MAG: hypothetical protein A2867_03570 [Candidatus Daviesbacteria bacterium RIFCSPHIGHO2_01_FULL_40_11]OGE62783.1 MAG: hypothetical protein A2964_01705 [Candidatus Daviesbacteria bacterium RIFCSPLOWO2_01_FULL_40_27]
MAKQTIWANTIVHNEENFIWFAIMSVIDWVDKMLVWDTGSTDKTVEIIEEIIKIKPRKIEFKEVGPVDKFEFTKMRQAQLSKSRCDWILILDGDEIWWEDSIEKLTYEINTKSEKLDGLVVPMIVPVGDIFHIQEELAGRYKIHNKKGHINLRAINRRIPGLHVDWPYGREGYFDADNKPVQNREGMVFLDAPYLHVTHLKRSTKARNYNKFKHELGEALPKDFQYPEVLYASYPNVISNPWKKLSGIEFAVSKAITPFKIIKRKLFK